MIRLAFTSDLHTDSHEANRRVWQEMVAILHDIQPDVFVCCGDIAADVQQFGVTLLALERLSCPKLLVPGNHDVWIPSATWLRNGISSWHKYYKLLPALCREVDFHALWMAPYVLNDIVFCGSMGWYDYTLRNPAFDAQFSQQAYRRKRYQDRLWNDARFVHWYAPADNDTRPVRLDDDMLTSHMVDELTQQLQHARQHARRIVAVTHMLPFRAMMRYQQEAQWDYFSAFMGSTRLGDMMQAHPEVECLLAGHTHRKLTTQIGRITAHTSPLGYARQWHDQSPLDVARQRLTVLELP